eukprot:m.325235 g.325235  ORF g.325235 m.325235 type:complete len:55 (+) comp109701_c0_seq1:35-199(+)
MTMFQGDTTPPEDMEFARRVKQIGILTEDTRDEYGMCVMVLGWWWVRVISLAIG